MNININEYIKNNRHEQNKFIAKRITCNDGFSMSVQAGEYNYCAPRFDDCDFYYEFEIGFPSEPEELIIYYAENESDPTGTVYGYVPIEIVEQVIVKRGGIKE